MTENTNPLSKYYRQPAVYIKFPSGGNYPPHVLERSPNGEYPVLPMTAKDELAFKTPDAMMNGQATIDVIKSCIPNIKDPWQLVSYDMDTILIAIRIASYGEKMDLNTTVPVANETMTHSINLPDLLDRLSQVKITNSCKLKDGLEITVRPLIYKQIIDSQIRTFQQQRIYMQVQQSTTMSDEEKTQKFTDSFNMLTELNSALLLNNIEKITLPDGKQSVSDPAQIKDFIENAESKLTKEIEEELSKIRLQGAVPPIQMQATEEQIKKGAPANYTIPITFDNSNFFV
jgi:hypothetical protein